MIEKINKENKNIVVNYICRTFRFATQPFFIALVEGLSCKPKYQANIIHHVIFIFFSFIFSITLIGVVIKFSVLSLKFGTQDFTDPGLLKIRW